MHAYLFNIKTFDQATRHLTRVERSLYRDLIDLYYDTERPLTAVDFDYLARRVLARTDEEKAALQCVLDEFFERTGDVYSHDYIDNEIERYKANNSQKSIAGKASAEARRKKAEERKKRRAIKSNEHSTHVEHALNTRSTAVQNHEQETMNHEPPKTLVADAPEFINADAWNEWIEYRKQSKKKMTPATVTKQTMFLAQYDKVIQAIIINQSIQNGWAGLFEPKGASNGIQNPTNNSRQAGYAGRPTKADEVRAARERARLRDSGGQSDMGSVVETQ